MAGRERAGTNIETKPSSAAPVQQNHPCNPEFVTLMPRLMEKEIEHLNCTAKEIRMSTRWSVGRGGRGRPRSDKRAFVALVKRLLFDDGLYLTSKKLNDESPCFRTLVRLSATTFSARWFL